ncbi:hypothetical protein LIA77_11825 [Sarocladium implicatum]|nr:hypothetical protein LIA77_11825 [Sarocladium implicatum]
MLPTPIPCATPGDSHTCSYPCKDWCVGLCPFILVLTRVITRPSPHQEGGRCTSFDEQDAPRPGTSSLSPIYLRSCTSAQPPSLGSYSSWYLTGRVGWETQVNARTSTTSSGHHGITSTGLDNSNVLGSQIGQPQKPCTSIAAAAQTLFLQGRILLCLPVIRLISMSGRNCSSLPKFEMHHPAESHALSSHQIQSEIRVQRPGASRVPETASSAATKISTHLQPRYDYRHSSLALSDENPGAWCCTSCI